ncbi:hypothetical protein BVG16_27475 [Paenibacillus selenitireducens]|uniref:Uncharacterized protein n=1 Tax=Paenibacillus selenitireducens TaxID=1324314 RepID=A0A1T2X1S4_9BACL|nr:hypothetical protein BVG16_27475 [Paenibacillus selenitireducens]
MLNKSISAKSILIIVYIIILIVFGLLLVPHYEVWGPEKNIHGYSYHTIFSLIDHKQTVNGFVVIYQLDYVKQIFIIGVLSALCTAVWLLLTQWEKEDHRK